MSPRQIFIAVVTASLLIGGVASADLSRSVIGAFRGQLVITKDELPQGKTDKETIAKIKAAKLKELVGETTEEVTYWNFHYTAFLKKTGATTLKMEFYIDGKKYVADKTLSGIDPKSTALAGTISINEDEGLTRGKSYVVKLVAGKNTIVAQTPLVMK